MGDKKNVLIVYAHPEPKSFNGALKDAAAETLRAQGHNVMLSDLHEMGFDPVASRESFKGKTVLIILSTRVYMHVMHQSFVTTAPPTPHTHTYGE